jgi:transposase
MLTLPPSVQLYVATQPVDGRKGIDGLSVHVQSVMQLSPLCGHLFIFFNRRHDQVQILYWDRNGYALWKKRLERGRFTLPERLLDPSGRATIEAAELGLILEGIPLEGARKRPRWEPAAKKESVVP